MGEKRIAQKTVPSTPLLPGFGEPRSRRKHKRHRQSEASQAALETIKQSRQRLYLVILVLLEQHGPAPGDCLTAREILRALKGRGLLPAGAERNSISPRLSELLDAGAVENPLDDNSAIYLKRVQGDASASTWRITSRGKDLLEALKRGQE